ncbi:MAG: cyclic nucleotide-binding domain-containing protein, partial [Myxococcota bacterium]
DTFEGPSASAATATRRGVAHENLHLAIVGAGPGGIAAGVQAAKRGVPHTLLERSKIAYTIERYQKGKFVMAEPPRLPLQETLDVGFEQGSREDVLAEWNRALEAAGVNARVGPEHELQKVDGELGAFKLHLRGGDVLDASHVILAVGVQGNLRAFGVDGDHLPHVTYQLDDPAEHSGKRVVVVGVGDAGIENAIALMEHDNDVTIVNRRDEFARAKPRNRLLIENAIRAGEIAYYKDSTVLRFEPDAVWLSTNDGEARLDADLVIGRLGAIPPRKFLEDMGIEFPSEARDAVPDVSEIYESNIPGIHVVGALAGYPLIKNCMNQGYEVVEHLLGEEVTPADEPVLRDRFAGLDGSVPEILEQIRTSIPIFAGLTTVQLRELLFDSEIRQLGPDEVVFELNDFTNSFFAIYSGSVDIVLPGTDVAERSDIAMAETSRSGAGERRVELTAGEFFGEGGLISGRRRPATVVANEGCVLIEVQRLVMNRLIHSVDSVRQMIDRFFIERALSNLLLNLPRTEIQQLAAESEICSFPPDQFLFHEGDEPDGLHFIRRGSVAITERRDGRDTIIQYVQAGNYVGEMAILVPGLKRSAGVRATVLTESMRIPTESVERFLGSNPEVRAEFEERAS